MRHALFNIRWSIIVAIFLVVQFFWLFASFAYSDTERTFDRTVGRRDDERFIVPEPAFEAITPVRSSLPPPTARSAFVVIGTSDLPRLDDLGSYIKYCLVFPFLNNAGPPIPAFDVPKCPSDPPPVEAPRLTVVKVVVNDGIGFATTSDFMLFVGSTLMSSGVSRTFQPGTYIVSEATTTITKGTTTLAYTQSFGGDCDSLGKISLSSGDKKICTVTNDDPRDPVSGGGPSTPSTGGGQAGSTGSGQAGSTPSTGSGFSSGGVGSPSSSASSSGGNTSTESVSSSGRSILPRGQVLGVVDPEFMGGADGIPGVPNAGLGGSASQNIGLLIFSFMSVVLGSFYIKMTL
ncbi:MAG: hypothetical protein AAB947_01870 [Patescibacteria group bacterium]